MRFVLVIKIEPLGTTREFQCFKHKFGEINWKSCNGNAFVPEAKNVCPGDAPSTSPYRCFLGTF